MFYFLIFILSQSTFAMEPPPPPPIPPPNESPSGEFAEAHKTAAHVQDPALAEADRRVLLVQKRALRLLTEVLGRSKGTNTESNLRVRVLDALGHISGLQFRLMHELGDAEGNPNAMYKAEYRESLERVIRETAEYLKRFQDANGCAAALMLRGHALTEIDNKAEAILAYRDLLARFPNSKNIFDASIKLHDLLVEKKDYKLALSYMLAIEKYTDSAYYTLILDHIAFSYYYQDQIQTGIKYLERELGALRKKNSLNHDQIFSNIALFYYRGLEQKQPGFSVGQMLEAFIALHPGKNLGVMTSYYMNLLRSKGEETDLISFYSSIMACTQFSFEYKLKVSQQLLARSVETKNIQSLTVILLATQRAMITTKGNSGDVSIPIDMVKQLISLVKDIESKKNTGMSQILDASISILHRSPEGRNPLGLLYFQLGDDNFERKQTKEALRFYGQAQANLARTEANGPFLKRLALQLTVLQYENLFENTQGFKSITPAGTNQINDWVKLVDQVEAVPDSEFYEKILMDSCRVLLQTGQKEQFEARAQKLYQKNSSNKIGESIVMLYEDYLIQGSKWRRVVELYPAQSRLFERHSSDFKNKLNLIAEDSHLRIIQDLYNGKLYADVLKEADSFYKTSEYKKVRGGEIVGLASRAALFLQQVKEAQKWLDRLSNGAQGGDAKLLLVKANINEKKDDWPGALDSYERALRVPAGQSGLKPEQVQTVRKKILFYAWLLSDRGKLQGYLDSPNFCGEDAKSCAHYRALETIWHSDTSSGSKNGGQSDSPENSAIWAAGELQTKAHRSMSQLRRLTQNWKSLDNTEKFFLLPRLLVSLPATYEQIRTDIQRTTPLRVDKNAIQKRVKEIKNFEDLLPAVASLGWRQFATDGSRAVGKLYSDFSQDILAIKIPDGISAEEKKEYQSTLSELALPFQEKAGNLERQVASIPASNAVLNSFDFLRKIGSNSTVNEAVVHALKEKNWPLVAYILQNAPDRNYWTGDELHVVRATALIIAGARAEAAKDLTQISPQANSHLVQVATILKGYCPQEKGQ